MGILNKGIFIFTCTFYIYPDLILNTKESCYITVNKDLLCQVFELRKNQINATHHSSVIVKRVYEAKSFLKFLPDSINSEFYILESTVDSGRKPVLIFIWNKFFFIKGKIVKNKFHLIKSGKQLSRADMELLRTKLIRYNSNKMFQDEILSLPQYENILSHISCNSDNSKLLVISKIFYD